MAQESQIEIALLCFSFLSSSVIRDSDMLSGLVSMLNALSGYLTSESTDPVIVSRIFILISQYQENLLLDARLSPAFARVFLANLHRRQSDPRFCLMHQAQGLLQYLLKSEPCRESLRAGAVQIVRCFLDAMTEVQVKIYFENLRELVIRFKEQLLLSPGLVAHLVDSLIALIVLKHAGLKRQAYQPATVYSFAILLAVAGWRELDRNELSEMETKLQRLYALIEISSEKTSDAKVLAIMHATLENSRRVSSIAEEHLRLLKPVFLR